MIRTHHPKKMKRLIWLLAGIVVAMFFFGYALVPLYNVLCKAWGINGKTQNWKANDSLTVDRSRTVTVLFLANRNANLRWEFRPLVRSITLHPGENKTLAFFAKNLSDQTMTVQAIPSVLPGPAARYLKKTECFCFTRQTFKAHEEMVMPLIFHLDPELPKSIHNIVLSYTLFGVSNKAGLEF